MDRVVFYIEFKFRKFIFKINKLYGFYKLYKDWCRLFNEISEEKYREQYDKTFL